MDAKVIDFWSYFYDIADKIPDVKDYNSGYMFILINEKISKIDDAILSGRKAECEKYIFSNIEEALNWYRAINHFREQFPENKNLAGLQGHILNLYEDLLRKVKNYFPHYLSNDRFIDTAKRYCSPQFYDLLIDTKSSYPLPKKTKVRPSDEKRILKESGTIKTIWKGSEAQLENLFHLLKNTIPSNSEIDKELPIFDGLNWNMNNEALAAFAFVLKRKILIDESLTPPTYLSVFKRTFNCKISESSTKTFTAYFNSFKEDKYTILFHKLVEGLTEKS